MRREDREYNRIVWIGIFKLIMEILTKKVGAI